MSQVKGEGVGRGVPGGVENYNKIQTNEVLTSFGSLYQISGFLKRFWEKACSMGRDPSFLRAVCKKRPDI